MSPPLLDIRVLGRASALRAAACLALTVLVAVAAVPAPAAAQRKGAAPSLSAAGAAEVNRLRASAGLRPVAADPALARAAQAQVEAMRRSGTMSHEIGGSFSSRIAQAGIRTTQAAENIAMGQRSLAEVMASWTASSGHRTNMLMASATRIGLARADGPGGPWWAMVLAAPEPPPRAAGQGPFGGGSGVILFGLPIPVSP
ncbi:CAP domain-containing protein [Alsobacter sp. R-9]